MLSVTGVSYRTKFTDSGTTGKDVAGKARKKNRGSWRGGQLPLFE
jgi:hypothetical protein